MTNQYGLESGLVTTNSDEGGYLVPNVVSTKKPGLLACIARWFSHPYGWSESRFAGEIIEKTKSESLLRQFGKELPDDYEPPIPISTRTGI